MNIKTETFEGFISFDDHNRPYVGITAEYALDYYIKDINDTLGRFAVGPNGYVEKVLGWFGFKYDAEADMQAQIQKATRLQIKEIFSSYTVGEHTEDDFKELCAGLMKPAQDLGRDFTHGHKNRTAIGIDIIKDYAKEYGFILDGTKKSWTMTKEVTE